MKDSNPPLKVWGYTFAVVTALLLFSIFGLKNASEKDKSEIAEMQAHINKTSKTNNKSHTTILFLGSSLTGNALYNLIDIKNRFKINNQNNIQVSRIAINSLDYQLLEDLHFFEYILKSPPDYLFIENNHINIDDEATNGNLEIVNSAVNNLISFTKKTIGLQEKKSIPFFKDTQNSRLHQNIFDTIVYTQLLKKKRLVRTFSQNKKANDAYNALIKRKTKIVFLDLPRATKLEQIWLNTSQKKELQMLLDTYHKKYGIDYWKYPYSMSDTDFIDGGHLNYKGAKKYQDWLIDQFKLLR